MAKDLTGSNIDRQNILNNPYAVAEIQKSIGLKGIEFNGKVVLLKEQVAAFFEVTLRTIENYLASNENELHQNGYEVLRGNSLKEFKLALSEQDVPETDFGNILKTPQLGILDFRVFLNLSMLIEMVAASVVKGYLTTDSDGKIVSRFNVALFYVLSH